MSRSDTLPRQGLSLFIAVTTDSLLSQRFAEAFAYAFELHRGQFRKRPPGDVDRAPIPYVAHLLAVTALVLEHGADEDESIAALLHDGPEDQGGRATLEEIRRRFGERVARIVEDCSDNLDDPEASWRQRKEGFVDLLRRGPRSPSTWLVSLADKVHNVRSIARDYRLFGDRIWTAFSSSREDKLWYYRTVLEIYQEKAPARCQALVDELERALTQLAVLVSGEKS